MTERYLSSSDPRRNSNDYLPWGKDAWDPTIPKSKEAVNAYKATKRRHGHPPGSQVQPILLSLMSIFLFVLYVSLQICVVLCTITFTGIVF